MSKESATAYVLLLLVLLAVAALAPVAAETTLRAHALAHEVQL